MHIHNIPYRPTNTTQNTHTDQGYCINNENMEYHTPARARMRPKQWPMTCPIGGSKRSPTVWVSQSVRFACAFSAELRRRQGECVYSHRSAMARTTVGATYRSTVSKISRCNAILARRNVYGDITRLHGEVRCFSLSRLCWGFIRNRRLRYSARLTIYLPYNVLRARI